MMEYKRLTERRETPLVMSMWGGSIKDLRIYNRLAELENKIEQGKLIEFPRIVKTKKLDAKYYVEIISDLFGGIIDCYEFDTREEAEKRLKELQNGDND